MRILVLACSLFMLLSLYACGGSYRQISTMNQYETDKVEQVKHSYAKCIVQKSLDLDDGKIDPKLIVDASSKDCDDLLGQMALDLKRRDFAPIQVDQYVEEAKNEGKRKALEAILRMRTQ
ncbi:hypothetical protein GM415_10470 [Pseudodesulfovibrio cashew]|uniref:Lipoprotein n=1 Tax=Pseudodesulfovibrio cashew TaxID=2678688 RepID=A0A6I6JH85_9BACT|nr:hypothetical protein [Pseudodesulfovibrio cashew]QGY40529.1 hypothetical protein GM415_10470 [Pseudodesulfovibrio cashew]